MPKAALLTRRKKRNSNPGSFQSSLLQVSNRCYRPWKVNAERNYYCLCAGRSFWYLCIFYDSFSCDANLSGSQRECLPPGQREDLLSDQDNEESVLLPAEFGQVGQSLGMFVGVLSLAFLNCDRGLLVLPNSTWDCSASPLPPCPGTWRGG